MDDDDAVADVSEAYRAAERWSKPSLIRNRRTIDRLADFLITEGRSFILVGADHVVSFVTRCLTALRSLSRPAARRS
jgi:hypothetical protein